MWGPGAVNKVRRRVKKLKGSYVKVLMYLTVAAPGSEELDKVVALGDVLGKGVLGEVHHLAQVGVLGFFALRLLQVGLGGCAQLLVDEVRDGGQVPSALELNRLLLALLEQAEGGVAGDLVGAAQGLVLGAIHLGDDHLGIVHVHDLGQLLPERLQALAVAAPGKG